MGELPTASNPRKRIKAHHNYRFGKSVEAISLLNFQTPAHGSSLSLPFPVLRILSIVKRPRSMRADVFGYNARGFSFEVQDVCASINQELNCSVSFVGDSDIAAKFSGHSKINTDADIAGLGVSLPMFPSLPASPLKPDS